MISSLETSKERNIVGLLMNWQRQSDELVTISFKGLQHVSLASFGAFKNGLQGSNCCMHCALAIAFCPRPGRIWSRLTLPPSHEQRLKNEDKFMRRNERKTFFFWLQGERKTFEDAAMIFNFNNESQKNY